MQKSKLVCFLKNAAISILILFVLIGGYVYWYKYTAKPASELCNSVSINSAFDNVYSRAREMGFKVTERPSPIVNEKIFAFSKQPNGESQCLMYVKDHKVVKKQYVLYL